MLKDKRTRRPLTGNMLACLLAAAGVGSMTAYAAAAIDTQPVELQPDGIHEVCMQLAAAEQLHYRFIASSELAFNIHYHAGNTVHYPVAEHAASRADTSFIPDTNQHYCLMWTNHGNQPVELRTQHAVVADSP